MGTQMDERSSPNAPPGLNPLAKLGWQIRLNQYKPTARETEVLSKCFEDGRWYYLNGAMFCGAAAWSATGLGGRLKFVPRVLMSGVAAYIGRYFGGQIAAYSCTKRILSLDGSPLQAELLAILREDYPDHPLLKTDVGRSNSGSPFSKSGSEQEDYAQEAHAPVSSKDWALEIEGSRGESGDWPEMSERGNGNGQERRIPRIWEIAERKEAMRKDDGADILADPFDIMMQTGIVIDQVSESGAKEQDGGEKRRSRMGVKERREYDRRRYEQRHEQQKD